MESKYYQYEKGMSYVPIPKAVAQMLKWGHKEKISMEIVNLNGKTGIFITSEMK